jgi:hypothetical protein
LKESALSDWLQQQNKAKNIAPISTQTWTEFEHAQSAEAPDTRPNTKQTQIATCERWAERHNVPSGKFSVGTAVPADRAFRKAMGNPIALAFFLRLGRHFWHLWDTFCGTKT